MPNCACGATFSAHYASLVQPGVGGSITALFCPGPLAQVPGALGPVAASLYTPLPAENSADA